MPTIVLDCPHCETESISFEFVGESPWDKRPGELSRTWNTFWECYKCGKAVVAGLLRYPLIYRTPAHCNRDPRDEGFFVHELSPPPPEQYVPEYLPEELSQGYREALDSLRRGNWVSAGMMFRILLERSTTQLEPEGVNFKGMGLVARINALAEQHIITPAMKDWAHIIRLDGNVAAHEGREAFEEKMATQMKDFAELFLVYAFTLPARVAIYRRGIQTGI